MKKRLVTSMLVAVLLIVATLFSACSSALEYGQGEAKKYMNIGKELYTGLELNIAGIADILDADVAKEIEKRIYEHKKKVDSQVAADVFKEEIKKYDDIGIFYNVTKDNETITYDGTSLIKLYPTWSTSTSKLTDATALTLNLGSKANGFWDLVEDKFIGRKPGAANDGEEEIRGALTAREKSAAVGAKDVIYFEYTTSYVQNGQITNSKTQYAGVDMNRLPSTLKDEDLAKVLQQYLSKDASSGKFLTKVAEIPAGTPEGNVVRAEDGTGKEALYIVKSEFADTDTAMTVDGVVTFYRKESKNNITTPVLYSVKVLYAAEAKPYTFDYTFAEDYEDKDLAGKTVQVDVYFKKDSLVHYEETLPELTYDFITGKLGFTPEGDVKDDTTVANLYRESVKKEMQAEVDEARKVAKMHALWNKLVASVKDPDWSNPVLKKTIDNFISEWKENVGALYSQITMFARQDEYMVNNKGSAFYLNNYAYTLLMNGDVAGYMMCTTYMNAKTDADKSLEALTYAYARSYSDNSAAAAVKDEATLNAFLQAAAKENCKQKLVIHYIADAEGLNPTEAEYEAYLQEQYDEYYVDAKAKYETARSDFETAKKAYEKAKKDYKSTDSKYITAENDYQSKKSAYESAEPYSKKDFLEMSGEQAMRDGFLWDTVMEALLSDEAFDNEFPQVYES